jgi:cytochrome P450
MSQSSTHTNDTPTPASSRLSEEKQGEKPPRHRTFSLLGSASAIQRDPLAFLLRTQQLGEVVRLHFLFSPAYLVSDPDSIKHILHSNERNYNKDLITYTLFRPLLGQGLLLNDGQSWLHQRRLMQPAFHRRRLSTYGTLMTDATVGMLEQWKSSCEKGTPVEIAEEMMRLTLQVVGRALFSLHLSEPGSLHHWLRNNDVTPTLCRVRLSTLPTFQRSYPAQPPSPTGDPLSRPGGLSPDR